MRRNNRYRSIWLKLLLCLLFFFTIQLHAQPPVRSYVVKNGKMFIALGKDLQKNSLDSFIRKYELYDLDLKHFMVTGIADSLHKLGWKVDVNNNEICVISKPLFSADNINDPGEKIIFTQKNADEKRFPNAGGQVHFGYNRFKNKPAFAVSDSLVTFFIRGNTNAKHVNLAGSFNDWQPAGLNMIRTDSGWICRLKLGAGKYWYKFIIDGNWTTDRDNSNTENDGMGNDNSVYYKTNYNFNLDGYTNAKKVYLSGSFNGWKESELLMQRTTNGWTMPVYLSEGTHTYRFIADGNWFTDPANPNKLPNEFNDYNSMITMGKPYLFKLEGYTDAKKVLLHGSFNGWKENELYLTRTATGWELPYVLGAGNYEYNYIVDGKDIYPGKSRDNLALVIEPNFTFRLKGFENAKTVCLAGDLNNWNPTSFRMTREGNEWIFKAHLNKGKQRYKFVVDGKWILDPANKLWEQNEYRTGNSVLWIDREN